MTKKLKLVFIQAYQDFELKDIKEATYYIKHLDSFKVLSNIAYVSHGEDDGNYFIYFEATIKAKKWVHIVNNIKGLFFNRLYHLQHFHNDYYQQFEKWDFNIELEN